MPKTPKIKQTRPERPLQASRFKPCPPKLAYFINLVNIFPGRLLPNPYEYKEKYDLNTIEGKFQATWECCKLLPESEALNEYMKLPDNLEQQASDEETYERAVMDITVNRYSLLEDACLTFVMLITRNEMFPDSYGEDMVTRMMGGPSWFIINKEGRIEIRPNPLEEALAGVEAARIKRCEVCEHVFWAGRMTQKGCSARCGDILRKRRYRERYKQGFYQGAKLTEEEKSTLKASRGRRITKKGK